VIRFTIGTNIIRKFSAYNRWNCAHGQADLCADQQPKILHCNDEFTLADVAGQLKRAADGAFLRCFGPSLKGQNE
jgi:hypothetical protein